jgi:hypothetical protein
VSRADAPSVTGGHSADGQCGTRCSLCRNLVQTHEVEVATLADRPELFDAAFGIPYADLDGSVFMQGSMVAALTCATRLTRLWPGCVLVLLDDEQVVARAVCVPFASTRTDRTPYPDGGWDQVSI